LRRDSSFFALENDQYHQPRGVVFNLDSHVGFGSRKKVLQIHQACFDNRGNKQLVSLKKCPFQIEDIELEYWFDQ